MHHFLSRLCWPLPEVHFAGHAHVKIVLDVGMWVTDWECGSLVTNYPRAASLASAFQSRIILFRWMKTEKVVFIQVNRSFDLSGPIKLATFSVFIHSKMEHKISKNRRNLYTSGKLRLFSQYDNHERNYKPVNDMCFHSF